MYNVILRCVCGTIVAVEQLEVLHNTDCMFVTKVSGMQCTCSKLSTVACQALYCFSTLCHKRHDVEKIIARKMCV